MLNKILYSLCSEEVKLVLKRMEDRPSDFHALSTRAGHQREPRPYQVQADSTAPVGSRRSSDRTRPPLADADRVGHLFQI